METGCTPTQNFVQMLRLMTPPMHREGIKKVYCSHNEVFYGEQGKLPSTSEMWLGLSWCLGGGDGVRVPACGQRLMCCVASIPASAKGRWAQVFSPTCTDMWQKGWDGGGLTVRHQKWDFDFFFFNKLGRSNRSTLSPRPIKPLSNTSSPWEPWASQVFSVCWVGAEVTSAFSGQWTRNFHSFRN